MAKIPKKVADRFAKQVKPYQRYLQKAKDGDINEDDTVAIVADILSDVFGFEKYSEVTREFAIKGTYCDLAIEMRGGIEYLVEVKAVGLTLKENHLRQAVNYGANHGVEWIVLTNGVNWEVYRVRFERPIGADLVSSFNFLELNPRKQEDQAKLFIMCKEGLSRGEMKRLHEYVRSVNKFRIGAVILSEKVLALITRELKKVSPGVKIEKQDIRKILTSDVLKRDVVEGEAADKAKGRVKKATKRKSKKRKASRKKKASTKIQPSKAEPADSKSAITPEAEQSLGETSEA